MDAPPLSTGLEGVGGGSRLEAAAAAVLGGSAGLVLKLVLFQLAEVLPAPLPAAPASVLSGVPQMYVCVCVFTVGS